MLDVVVVVVVVGAAPALDQASAAPVHRARPVAGATLPPALRAALVRRGAFTTAPVRLLLLGDSLAVTLSVGLGTDSVADYGVIVLDQADFGCDLDTSPAIYQGKVTYPLSPCRDVGPLWAQKVAAQHPDVIALLIGRWSVTDRQVGGQVVHVGQPAEDARLLAIYTAGLRQLAATGLPVVLYTTPCFGSPDTAPDGSTWPEDQPDRVPALDRVLVQAARAAGPRVTVVDLHHLLCPQGKFVRVLHGITVRWPDGLHITPAGGRWLQPLLFPTIDRLALDASSARTARAPVTTAAGR